jgi:hypothetical protein
MKKRMINKPRLIHVGYDISNREISFTYMGEDGKGAKLSFTESFLGKKASRRLIAMAESGW